MQCRVWTQSGKIVFTECAVTPWPVARFTHAFLGAMDMLQGYGSDDEEEDEEESSGEEEEESSGEEEEEY